MGQEQTARTSSNLSMAAKLELMDQTGMGQRKNNAEGIGAFGVGVIIKDIQGQYHFDADVPYSRIVNVWDSVADVAGLFYFLEGPASFAEDMIFGKKISPGDTLHLLKLYQDEEMIFEAKKYKLGKDKEELDLQLREHTAKVYTQEKADEIQLQKIQDQLEDQYFLNMAKGYNEIGMKKAAKGVANYHTRQRTGEAHYNI